MKVAHISDLHLSIKRKPWAFTAINKLFRKIAESQIEHLVITGDIADNADEHDFIVFRKLLKSFDLLDASRTSIVVGNHDIYGGPQTAQDILNFPSKCLSIDYDEKLKNFTQYYYELFENCFFPLDGKIFPYAKKLDNNVFIGLNTIDEYSRLRNPFASNGHVSQIEREGLDKIFEEFPNEKRIILAHHHFYKNRIPAKSSEGGLWNRIENYTMKLRGKKKLLKTFSRNNVELILHGHSHEMNDYSRKGIHVLNAGGTFDNGEKNLMKFFLVDILLSNIEVNLETVPYELMLPKLDYSNQLIESHAG